MASSFTGGQKLQQHLQQIISQLGDDPQVRVGFLEGSTCGKDNSASAPTVAYINEVGAPEAHIPPRPFFKQMIAKRSPSWGKLLAASLKNQNFKIRPAFEMVGLKMSEQLQQSIEEFDDPANADSTIARKGFDSPLQDSKNMKRAASFEVNLESA